MWNSALTRLNIALYVHCRVYKLTGIAARPTFADDLSQCPVG